MIKNLKTTAWLLLVAVIGLSRPALAQPPVTLAQCTSWNVASGNWTTAGNWIGAFGGTAGVPDVNVQDFGIIENGGTATINTVVSPQAGGVSLGTNGGQSGTLDITAGGSLTVVDDSGTLPSDGSVRIGQGGIGTLFVRPGATLNSVSLALGTNSASKLVLGGTTASASVLHTGTVTLAGTTRVTGPLVDFAATGPISFQGTSTYIPEITGATHSKLKSTGLVTVAGTLQVDFNGTTPTSSSTWDLIDAASISNSFSTIVGDPGAPLGLGQSFNTRIVNGGTNGKLLQLYVTQKPVLSINRNTGAMSITNPGATGILLDGYTVASDRGALSQTNWQSFTTHSGVAGAGWSDANPSPYNRLSELRASGDVTLPASGSWSLGTSYVYHQPTPTQFGEDVEDVTFQYTRKDGTIDNGVVDYTGGTGVNNLVLFVNPATGNVKIRNTSPFQVQIDGYSIASLTGGSLNSNPASWTSLQDSLGSTWGESDLTDNRISELKASGSTTLNANGGTTFDLGTLFKTANLKDLEFDFLLPGQSLPNHGVVVYEAAPAVTPIVGDYNHNGIVDAADYSVWRDTFGSTTDLRGDGDVNLSNGANDFTTWKNRLNATSGAGGGGLAGSGNVPEPATWLLMCLGGLAMFANRRIRSL